MGIFVRIIVGAAAVLSVNMVLAAEQLAAPTSLVILQVTGKIAQANRGAAAVFDRTMIETIGLKHLHTSTAFTDGRKTFEGIMVRDLLAQVRTGGATKVTARALNDYTVDIPLSDFDRYDVLLALRMDGQDLTARDKGPLWIVYPPDDFPELQDERYDHRWIWQLNRLELK